MKAIKLFALAMPLALSLNIDVANAEVINLNTISSTTPFSFTLPPGGSPLFLDTVLFTLGFDTAIITEVPAVTGGTVFKMDLLSSTDIFITNETISPFKIETLLLPGIIGFSSPFVTSTGLLKAGSYKLNFKSTDATRFSGSINIAAVPEPETYAMLLAGLGLIGFTARRRKTQA